MNLNKILITGGSGMIGKNLIEKLKKYQFKYEAPNSRDLNLLDYSQTIELLKKNKFDIVIHLAALVGGIHANVKNQYKFLINNLEINKNIILASKEAGIKKFINVSSTCVYPRNFIKPISETDLLSGKLEETNEGYALSKIVAMKLCEYISNNDNDFFYKTLIPCNMYGRYDNFDPENSHLIAGIIYKIHFAKKNNQKKVLIWSNGNVKREFLYAGDFADAIIKSLHDFENLPMKINIGVGKDYSIKEYYEIVKEIIGWDGEWDFDLSKPEGMQRKLSNTSLQKRWGWEPKIDIYTGITKTYEYYKQSINKKN